MLEAYRRAAGKVSINRLVGLLARLTDRYPYHQAVGFYLEKAGSYKPARLNLLRKLACPLDFYLTHDMRATAYCPQRRLCITRSDAEAAIRCCTSPPRSPRKNRSRAESRRS